MMVVMDEQKQKDDKKVKIEWSKGWLPVIIVAVFILLVFQPWRPAVAEDPRGWILIVIFWAMPVWLPILLVVLLVAVILNRRRKRKRGMSTAIITKDRKVRIGAVVGGLVLLFAALFIVLLLRSIM